MSGKTRKLDTKPAVDIVTRSWGMRDTIVLAIALLAGSGFCLAAWKYFDPALKSKPLVGSAVQAAPQATPAASNVEPVTTPPVTGGFPTLRGRWIRNDGGYVIDVKNVDASGKMDAAYLNPNPIRVARADASQANGTLRMFIELRDVNYPGSTYDLIYNPATDQLAGEYFQAAQDQRFQVAFERLQ